MFFGTTWGPLVWVLLGEIFPNKIRASALAVAAASLLYVAVADLIPGLHRRVDVRSSVMQVLLIGCGIAVIAFAETYAH